MKHELSTGEQITSVLLTLLPLLIFALTVIMLVDCYRKARNNRPLWMIIIILTGPLGYGFFYFSKDRIK